MVKPRKDHDLPGKVTVVPLGPPMMVVGAPLLPIVLVTTEPGVVPFEGPPTKTVAVLPSGNVVNMPSPQTGDGVGELVVVLFCGTWT